MGDIGRWLVDHWPELLAAAYALASVIVAATPTPTDDAVLARVVARLSFLLPRDVRGILKVPGKEPPRPRRGRDER